MAASLDESRYLDAVIIPTQASERRTRKKAERIAYDPATCGDQLAIVRKSAEAEEGVAECFLFNYVSLKENRSPLPGLEYLTGMVVASGGKTPALSPRYTSGADLVSETLLEIGIPLSKIKFEGKSRDNVENILFSLKQAGLGDYDAQTNKKIGIISYPHHLDRFEQIINEAKRQGIINPTLTVYRIETDEKWIEKVYEIAARRFTARRLEQGFENIGQTGNLTEGFVKTLINYAMKWLS